MSCVAHRSFGDALHLLAIFDEKREVEHPDHRLDRVEHRRRDVHLHGAEPQPLEHLLVFAELARAEDADLDPLRHARFEELFELLGAAVEGESGKPMCPRRMTSLPSSGTAAGQRHEQRANENPATFHGEESSILIRCVSMSLADELRGRIEGEVRFDRYTRTLYSTDASIYQVEPIGVVIPRHAGTSRRPCASPRAKGVPILPRGGGTSLAGQAVGEAVILDFSKYMRERRRSLARRVGGRGFSPASSTTCSART